jgi:hypothetical protein
MQRTWVRVEYSAFFSGTERQNAKDLGESEVLCFLLRYSEAESRGPE